MALLILFTFMILGSSIYRLYLHFSDNGMPQSAGDLLNSWVLVSLLLLVTSLGLLKSKSWGRTFALGICIGGLGAGIAFFAFSIYNLPALLMAFGLFLMIFQKYLVFLNNSMSVVAMLIGSVVISVLLAILLIRALTSEEAKNRFGEDEWFGYELHWKNIDLKPWIIAGLFLFLHYFDSVVPRQFHAQMNEKAFQVTQQKLTQALEKDPVYQKEKQQQQEYAEKLEDDKRRVVGIDFTTDESKIWIVTSDQKLHLYDLKSYTSKVFPFGSFASHKRNHLSSDGEFFYDEDKHSVFKSLDQTAYGIPKKNRVLGFAQPGTEILLWNEQDRSLIRFDFIQQRESWNQKLDPDFKLQSHGLIWSVDRQTIFGGESKSFFIISLKDGAVSKYNLEMRYPEFSFFDFKTKKMFLSGPVAFGEDYRSYEVDGTTITELPSEMALIGYVPNLDVYLSYRGKEFQIIPSDFEDEKIQKFELGYGLKSFISPTAKNILVIGGNQISAENFELATKSKKNIGQPYTKERSMDQSVCQSRSSISGRLVLVACRQRAELFWMNELAKEKPSTWQFQIPIGKPKK